MRKTLQTGAVLLFACSVNTSTFAQSQKSILSLDRSITADSQAVLPNGKTAPVAPANFHSFSEARSGELADAERLTLRFAETTKLTKIDSTKDFHVEQGSSCVVGNVYQARSTCTLLVRFMPQGAGRRVGKLTIAHTGSVTPFYVGLGGNGYAPVLSFVPSVITTVPASLVSGKGLLSGASSLAVDGGDTLYAADTGNGVIRSIDSSGVALTVSSGSLAAYGVAVDNFGEIFFDVPASNAVYEIFDYGSQFQLGGAGTDNCTTSALCSITSEKLYLPGQMSIDPNNGIFMVEQLRGAMVAYAQPYPAKIARLYDPFTFQNVNQGTVAVDQYDNIYSLWSITNVCQILSQYFSDAANSIQVYKKVAGGKTCGFSGDGGPARNAQIGAVVPQFAFDVAGDMYFSDSANQRVRRIDAATGNINTIAGTGTAGYAGDGNSATSATLNKPTGVGVDSQGQVYVISSATTGQVIRKIGPNGFLSFGNVARNTASTAKLVTLTNTGNSTLTFTHVGLTGGTVNDFGIDPNTTSCDTTAGASLATGQSCKIGVIFKPSAGGNRTTSLVFLDNTVTNSNTVTLLGTGTLPSAAFAIAAPAVGASFVSGTTVKFSVSVAGTPAPTGTVKFTVDGAAYGSPVAISAGAAAVNLTGLTTASHTLGATYSGDTNYAASGPITRAIKVTAAAAKQPVTVKLASTIAAPTTCTKIPFAVTVASTKTPLASGVVQIREGTKVLITGTLSSGKVTVTLPTLAAGTHSLSAYYPGDTGHTPATSPAVSQVVKAGGACTTVKPGPVKKIARLK